MTNYIYLCIIGKNKSILIDTCMNNIFERLTSSVKDTESVHIIYLGIANNTFVLPFETIKYLVDSEV